jgi:hypothetical protein
MQCDNNREDDYSEQPLASPANASRAKDGAMGCE